LGSMGQDIRWSKTPKFKCTCGVERVWRALKLLASHDVKSIIEEGKDVSISCGFCGKTYSVTAEDIQREIPGI
jgi:molecular chaperone Hsp33